MEKHNQGRKNLAFWKDQQNWQMLNWQEKITQFTTKRNEKGDIANNLQKYKLFQKTTEDGTFPIHWSQNYSHIQARDCTRK